MQNNFISGRFCAAMDGSCHTYVENLVRLLSLRDIETEEHTHRVAVLSTKLALAIGFSNNKLFQIYQGALLHDVGKIGIPDSILNKTDNLNDTEMALMRMHPIYAYELFFSLPCLRPILDIAYCHHEKWDGTGYPRGLQGEQIPLEARLFAVVDVWDALTSDRPYRSRWSEQKAYDYIKEQSGRYFDPAIVSTFLEKFFHFDTYSGEVRFVMDEGSVMDSELSENE